jgi:hypothetical protein
MKSRSILVSVAVLLGLLLSGAILLHGPQAQARVVEPEQRPAALSALPVIDDFEGWLPAGKDANNIPIGFSTFADPNSTAAISATDAAPAPTAPGHGSGNHVLKLDLNVVAWAGVTHGFENAAVNTWVTQDWSVYEGISFYLYGTGAGTDLFVDVLDNRNPGSTKDDAERWTFAFKDNFTGWKLIQIPFASMTRKEIGNGAPNDGFGLTEVHVTAKLSKPSSVPVTVQYQTTIGPAIPNRDYNAPVGGTLIFPPNVTQQSFPVVTIDDNKYQGERGVLVELSNPTGGAALGLPPIARIASNAGEFGALAAFSNCGGYHSQASRRDFVLAQMPGV